MPGWPGASVISRVRVARALVGLAAASLVGWLAFSLFVGRPPEGPHRPPEGLAGFRQLLPRDAILPVYRPRFVPAARAGLRPDELVIGVEIAGEARAYPVGYLNFREMVNDRIGPVPFLVTW